MRHIKGQNRHQVILFPETLDDYIPEKSQVRFIDGFVDTLDLHELGYTKALPKSTGRKPYHPGDLLKLYLYGYLHRIRSSRGLEKETRRNVEVMWLIKRLTPDFKTIADFRKENSEAVQNTFKHFTMCCRRIGLYKGELLAIDGSVFKAVNSKDKVLTKKKLALQLSDIEKDIRGYLEEMDRMDQEEDELYGDSEKDLDPEKIKEILEDLKQQKHQKLSQMEELADSDVNQKALSDSEACLMKKRGSGSVVGYNVQTVVDDKHKLIVAYKVTNDSNDKSHLLPMVKKARQALEFEKTKVVADSGYYNGDHISKADKLGVETYIPVVNTSTNKVHGRYDKKHFIYDHEKDVYSCPAGEKLRMTYEEKKGKRRKFYTTKACSQCEQRSDCTTNKNGRVIYRYAYEAALEALAERNRNKPSIQKRRKSIVEHPFGTLKRNWGYDHFLVKGKEKVNGEMGLMLLAYNMKRVMNIHGTKALEKISEV